MSLATLPTLSATLRPHSRLSGEKTCFWHLPQATHERKKRGSQPDSLLRPGENGHTLELLEKRKPESRIFPGKMTPLQSGEAVTNTQAAPGPSPERSNRGGRRNASPTGRADVPAGAGPSAVTAEPGQVQWESCWAAAAAL